MKSIVGAARCSRSTRIAHLDPRAVVQRQREVAVLQARDHAAHRLLGVVLHVAACRPARRRRPNCVDHLAQLLHALLVGGDLRLAGRPCSARGCAPGSGPLAQQSRSISASRSMPRSTSLHVVDLHALLLDARRERRHRAGRDAADVGVVAARADVEQGLVPRAVRGTPA